MIAAKLLTINSLSLLGAPLCGIGVLLYYLFPYTISSLGISPHILFIVASWLLCILRSGFLINKAELLILVLLCGALFLSFSFSPSPWDTTLLRGWFFSIITFIACRLSFNKLSYANIILSAQILLGLYSLSSFAQVFIGNIGYVSSWLGQDIGTRYATGLASFTNQAALIIITLLAAVMHDCLNRLTFFKALLWGVGVASLYYTLSRAGWLSLFIILAFFLYNSYRTPQKRKNWFLCVGIAGLAVAIAWALPSKISEYQPGGRLSEGRWVLSDKLFPSDYSAISRIATSLVAEKAISLHPFTGLGLGQFPSFYAPLMEDMKIFIGSDLDPRADLTPHNAYAQFASEIGIPSFIMMLVYFIFLFGRIAKYPSDVCKIFTGSIIGTAIFMLFHDGFVDRLLWIQLGIGISFVTFRTRLT